MRTCAVIMTAIHASLGFAGAGCSFDPPPPDPGVDSGLPGDEQLVIGLADAKLAQAQRLRLRVTMVFLDGAMQDVTANAILESDNAAVASSPAPGQIDGGAQAGTATITARLGGARPATMKVTVTPKPCRPVINEFQTGGAASSAEEWVELLNPCTSPINVTSWMLVYRAPTATTGGDTSSLFTLSGSLAPGEIRLYAGQGYAGTNDGGWPSATGLLAQSSGAIALRMDSTGMGPIADAVAYGVVSPGHPFIETAAAAQMVNGRPAQRQPFDGRDDDDSSIDFMQVTTGTPRAPNAP